MPAEQRAHRAERRRRFGQNFLRPDLGEALVAGCDFRPGDRVVEIGAGAGALTLALARRGLEVTALERDPEWARWLGSRLSGSARVRVVEADVLRWRFPATPFRVIGSVPFGVTTEILRRLFDDPRTPLVRADLVLQWEVARKRSESPPATLLSAAWAPWWRFRLGRRIPASAFRPEPSIDAGLLTVTRREPALLPLEAARAYAKFLRKEWPFRGG